MRHIGDVLEGKEKKELTPDEKFDLHAAKVDEWFRKRLPGPAYQYFVFRHDNGDKWAETMWKRVSDIVAGRPVMKQQPWMYDERDYRA